MKLLWDLVIIYKKSKESSKSNKVNKKCEDIVHIQVSFFF